jgi:dTDP-4-amino-4,6-dideoxygalactose transaminase
MDLVCIPILRPRLPDTDALIPYLRRIDAARTYSNMGPLACELAAALQERFAAIAVPVANATLGLAAALLAQAPRPGHLCMVPSWTFAASGHAIRAAGLEPWLVDVDPDSGALTPDRADRALRHAPGPVAAVMPVAPFGAAPDAAGWDDFARRSGRAVVVDAAASFDSLRAAAVPQVVSLHATKVLGAGEGGFVLCGDPDLARRVGAACNFGFAGSRSASLRALNAKMSEYHAAIALAALAAWPRTRDAHADLLSRLKQALPDWAWPTGLGDAHVTNTLVARFPMGADRAEAHLTRHGIETRRWWGMGLHRQPAFADCPRQDLPNTERLAGLSLGLPCHLDLGADDIRRLADSVAGV